MLRFHEFSRTFRSTKTVNYHNSPNMQPITIFFQGLLKFIKFHLWLSFQNNWTCFVIGMLHVSRFLFLINFQRHMHSIYVWNMIKRSKPLQTRYNTTHIYDRYYIRTHVYVFLFSVKKTRVLIIASLTLKVASWGYPIHGIYWPSLSLDY